MNQPAYLLQQIGEAIITTDKEGYIVFANAAIEAITGYRPEECANKNLSIFYAHSDDVIKAEYELGVARKQGRFTTEGWKRKKDGTLIWVDMTLAPLYEEGQHSGFSCIIRDVNDRKELELQLRKSEERYRLMVEGVKDYAIFMLDPEGYILTWNEGAKKTKGYSANEIIGKHFSTFYTSEDLETKKPERELVIARATGKYEEEGWRVKKNGSVFWANVVITSLYNQLNQLIGFSKVTRDLTERKEHDESLRQSEERYRSLVEQVTDYGIFMMDEKGRIISWNEGAKKIKGYTADEIIGKYFTIFYPEEDILNGKPAHELKVAVAEGKYEEEGWRLRKDGSRFWANVVITAVYNNNGIHIGFSKVTRDLTERKESEKALRESYEKYRMLTEELRVTNTELSDANKELEQFTSIVSHDLQEPIRTIKSFLTLIDIKLSSEQSVDLQTYISKSIAAADRMRELIRNLLNYSQVSKGDLKYETVYVNDIVQQVLQNLKTAIDTAHAQIVVKNEVDTVQGDPVQLMQLLQNLIGNALKFTKAAQPRIDISCRREEGQVKFEVADNGIGIAKSDMTKIFQVFKRLNSEKEYPGTGIGLAICKRIVDRHGGRIWPESEPGKGTTFHFTLKEEKPNYTALS